MTTHLRIIHAEHRADALAPGNPMRDVPEVIRVYTNPDGSLSLYQVAKGYLTTEEAVKHIANTGLIWHQDILRGAGAVPMDLSEAVTLDGGFRYNPYVPYRKARKGIQGLVRLLESFGIDLTAITLCTDWELWSDDPVWDHGNWSAAVQDWPGTTANFGNAIACVPPMFHWPNVKGSCWASHGTGTTPDAFKDGILKAKPYWRSKRGPAIACIADPKFFATPTNQAGNALHRQYITASRRADIILHWPLWPGDDERAKQPGFRLEQDRLIARAIGRVS